MKLYRTVELESGTELETCDCIRDQREIMVAAGWRTTPEATVEAVSADSELTTDEKIAAKKAAKKAKANG